MKFRFVLAVALAGLTLAACGSSNDAAKPNAAAAAAPTTAKADPAELSAWVDKVCGVRNTALAPTKPRVGILVTTADANKFKTKLVESMTTAAQGNDKAVTDLAALKSGPSPDSGKLIEHQSEKLKERKTKLTETIAKVQAMKTNDPAEFNTGAIQVQDDLGTDNSAVYNLEPGMIERDLADAYKAAPNCKTKP
jgi:hypothetical protein